MTLTLRELVPQSRGTVSAISSPFAHAGLLPLSYDLGLGDPPWDYQNWALSGMGRHAAQHYETQTLSWICSLPVSELFRGDALLVLWATWPMLLHAHVVMRAWGFEYKTGGAWFKRSKVNAMPWQGTGYVLRSACEPFLVGTLGSPLTKAQRGALETFHDTNVIDGKIREHSRKPDLIYPLCEELTPRGLKAVELFGRQQYKGGRMSWSVWGDQVAKFDFEGKVLARTIAAPDPVPVITQSWIPPAQLGIDPSATADAMAAAAQAAASMSMLDLVGGAGTAHAADVIEQAVAPARSLLSPEYLDLAKKRGSLVEAFPEMVPLPAVVVEMDHRLAVAGYLPDEAQDARPAPPPKGAAKRTGAKKAAPAAMPDARRTSWPAGHVIRMHNTADEGIATCQCGWEHRRPWKSDYGPQELEIELHWRDGERAEHAERTRLAALPSTSDEDNPGREIPGRRRKPAAKPRRAKDAPAVAALKADAAAITVGARKRFKTKGGMKTTSLSGIARGGSGKGRSRSGYR